MGPQVHFANQENKDPRRTGVPVATGTLRTPTKQRFQKNGGGGHLNMLRRRFDMGLIRTAATKTKEHVSSANFSVTMSRLLQRGHAAERANVVPQVCDEWLTLAWLCNHVAATSTRQNHLPLRVAECKHRPQISLLSGDRRTGLRKRVEKTKFVVEVNSE